MKPLGELIKDKIVKIKASNAEQRKVRDMIKAKADKVVQEEKLKQEKEAAQFKEKINGG